jgi:hypothetical protein
LFFLWHWGLYPSLGGKCSATLSHLQPFCFHFVFEQVSHYLFAWTSLKFTALFLSNS